MARTLLLALAVIVPLFPVTSVSQPAMETPSVNSADNSKSEGTQKMVEILKQISKSYQNYHNILANKLRVKFLSDLLKENPDNELTLYQEMLFAGETESAIKGLEKVWSRPGLDSFNQMKVGRMLSIGYLRLAEQENCVANHTAQSCLFPIREGGVHSIQRGSRKAIEALTFILKNDPGDVKSRWLLNIAYQTLGEYPDNVPPEYLYPPEIFRSDYEMAPFIDIAPALGLDLERLSGGCSIEDFDRDGDIDIMMSSWGVDDQLLYFRNNGDGSFTDRTVQSGLTGLTGGLNMFHADYNNDGYADVFITRGAWMGVYGRHPNSLLKNNGDGTFSDVTIESGTLSYFPTEAAAWGDFNNDGWVDLFIGNETTYDRYPSELYKNNGDGTFTNVAAEVGLDVVGMIKAVVWGDYDNDGFIDLYISCLGGANRLMKNNGKKKGKWSFTNVADKAGVSEPNYSFPTFFFDYDNDGWLDIFVSDFGGKPTDYINGLPAKMDVIGPVVNDFLGKPSIVTVPKLYHNNRNGTFTDVAKEMNLDKTLFGMGCNFGDLDNDGYLDIYIGTGHPDLDVLIPNRMFRNAEGKIFQDVTGSGGFGHLQKGHGIAFADIDNDGDQDIFAEMGGAFEGDVARQVLFQNPGSGNHWVTLVLQGVKANRAGIGARIKVTVQRADGKSRDIYVTAGTGGSFGSSSLQQEIGLGDAQRIKSITIDWPGSHTKQTLSNVAMDSVIKVREGSSEIATEGPDTITMPPAAKKGGGGHEHHDHHDHHNHDHNYGQ